MKNSLENILFLYNKNEISFTVISFSFPHLKHYLIKKNQITAKNIPITMINAGTKIISAAIIIAQVSFFVTGFLRRFSFISFSSSGVTSLNIFCLFIEVARYKMSWFYLS